MTQKKLDDWSDEELVRELAQRRASRVVGDMTAAEDAGESHQVADASVYLAEIVDRAVATSEDGRPKACPRCGMRCRVRVKNRARTIRTTMGERTFERHYHYCVTCKRGFYPVDRALGLPEEGELSRKMEARVLDFGVNETYAEASARWSVHHAGTISETLIHRVVERAGRHAEASDLETMHRALRPPVGDVISLLVVQTDGSMVPTRGVDRWKEAKLGVIYREEHHTPAREGGRGCITEARYVATLGSLNEFRKNIDAALRVEDAEHSARVAWLGDGAPWNWTLADETCRFATQILDWTHAVEHAIDCGKVVLGEQSDTLPVWEARVRHLLWEGDVDTLISELQACLFTTQGNEREAIQDLIRYYTTNANRMRYAEYRADGLPIGSGTVESGHRHVFQKRMKLAGQHWALEHARRMVLLRAAYRTAGAQRFAAAIWAGALPVAV